MMAMFFTSDTHFGSKRTLELSRRPFKSVEEMDEVLIENWNETVGKRDIVVHLGDFGDFSIRPELNGYLILLQGNYERDIKNIDELFADYFNVSDHLYNRNKLHDVLELSSDSIPRVNLCHEPMNMQAGITNLFGHVHKLSLVKKFTDGSGLNWGINVGTDCHFFKPITLATIEFYNTAILQHYDENVFI